MSKTLQQEIANSITQKFKDAVVKKIDKDNYLDIHIPAISEKIGTHFTFNTTRNGIKLLVYSKDEALCEQFMENSSQLEPATRGVRLKDNPIYETVDEAIEGALFFIGELSGLKKEPVLKKAVPKKAVPKKAAKKKDYKPIDQEDAAFSEISIGRQIWMSSNLSVTTFRNGDLIPEAKSEADWARAGENGEPAWCYYENDEGNGCKFGILYNWYAVNDERGLAPQGWHVASEEEWLGLYKTRPDDFTYSIAMASTWGEDPEKELNSTGFSALPAGVRFFSSLIESNFPLPVFSGLGQLSTWWTSTAKNDENAIVFSIVNTDGLSFGKGYYFKSGGSSVRCIKDLSNTDASNQKEKSKESISGDFYEMVKAYKKGDLNKVAEYIENGAIPLQFSQDESLIENELITICVTDPVDINALKKVIERGEDLNVQNNDSDKYTAVHYCAWDGKAEALSILLKKGALPDIVGEDGRTALHLAAANGFTDVVKLLVIAGVDIDRRIPNDFNTFYSDNGSTAIREALYNQNWDIVDLLIKNGADLTNLTEPCSQSFEGTNDLFEVIRMSNEKGLYPDGNFNEIKLNNLEKEIKGDSNKKEDEVDFFELLKRNLNSNTEDLSKAVLGQEEETEEYEEEDDTIAEEIDSIEEDEIVKEEEEEIVEEELEDEDDEKGFPVISYRIPSEDLKDVLNAYFKQWQKPSIIYAWIMGITAYVPEFVGELVSNDVCPIFTNEQIDAIYNKIYNDKLIPILDYAPAELLNHTKRVWWIVPFCIIKEEVASMVFVDKDGFYAGYITDFDAYLKGEVEADFQMIFPWDKVDELEFQTDIDDDLNVCRLTLHRENGGYLTFDEFISETEDDNHGSYLKVIEAIWEARRVTIEASRGKSIWLEGEGGETFRVYEHPSELCRADVEEETNNDTDNSTKNSEPVKNVNKESVPQFKSVKIGNQIWMAENLNVDRFRNGDVIPEVNDLDEWKKAGEQKRPAWCYYNFDVSNGNIYGKLYNWFAVIDPRGLAPNGWIVPHEKDFRELAQFLGGEDISGVQLKSIDFWEKEGEVEDEESKGTNQSGFNGLPGGSMFFSKNVNYKFLGSGGRVVFWTQTTDPNDEDDPICWSLRFNFTDIDKTVNFKTCGYSVRCIQHDGQVILDKKDDEQKVGQESEKPKGQDEFYIGKIYEKFYHRFIEITEKTGILLGRDDKIKSMPDENEREEVWKIVRVFVDRIYQIDNEKTPDVNELNTLCFYTIVALHWCDIYITDKRFQTTNGRFRRDTIALALCFYARIDRSYDYYDHVKLQFIMPHMQFSVLLWSINSIVNLGQDNLFGMFTKDQAQKAQQLFTEIDKQNQEEGGYGVVAPDKMPNNHPLRAIWVEVFTLFNNVRIPYQFIRNYISLELPKRSFLQGLFSGKGNNDPGVNVTLLDTDKQNNLAFLDKEMLHKQFPDDWNLYDDLTLVYIYFATSDGNFSKEEKENIVTLIGEWVGEEDLKKLNQIVNASITKAQTLINKDNSEERFSFALENIRRHFYVKFEHDTEKTNVQLKLISIDLIKIAEVDDFWEDEESRLFELITNEWGVSFKDDTENESENEDEEVDEEEEKLKTLLVKYGVDSESELTSITVEQAKELSGYKGYVLDLSGLTSLSEKSVDILAKHKGNLMLDGLTSISDKALECIASHSGGYLSLDGLTNLSDKALQILSLHKELLYLNGLTSLSDKAASILSKHKGSLVLNGLTELSEKAIEILALNHRGYLSLDGFTSLSDKSLMALANHDGDLYLGITSLSDKAALALSNHKGELSLNGVTTLSDKAAFALAKHEGEINMDGLTSLSDKAAEALAVKGISISQDEESEEEESEEDESEKTDDSEIKINDTHVEFFLYLTMGKTDDDLSDDEISTIINFLVEKYKNQANRNIIEKIFDESFKWWLDSLKNGTVYDELNKNLNLLDEFSSNEKLVVIKNLKKISLLDKNKATKDENELIQILNKRWGI